MEEFDFTDSPLHQDDRGVIRVIGSRITLTTLVGAFKRGDTLEEIHEGFPSLTLDQIRSVIAWYLNHTGEADDYIQEAEAKHETLRREIESRPGYNDFKELIKQRWEQLTKQHEEQLTKS